jgi:hypothetical protein
MKKVQSRQPLSGKVLWRMDRLPSGDFVNSGRCCVTPATYKHATIEQPGYAAHF